MSEVELDEMGPIDYLVVEFPPAARPDGVALSILRDLHDRRVIRVLDLAFVRRSDAGEVVVIEIADTDLDGDVDAVLFAEASSGLLDQDDLDEAGSVLEPGATAAIMVYENSWAAPFAMALRRTGAQLVAGGRIPTQAILETLDSLEATS